MGKSVNDLVLDGAFEVLDAGNLMTACSAEPTTRTEALTTYALADAVMTPVTDYAKANGDTNGRKCTMAAKATQDIDASGKPKLPSTVQQAHGQCRVPVFPTPLLYDSLTFRPMTAETWLLPGVDPDDVCGESTARLQGKGLEPEVNVVLGAGNVSSIAATDALTKILIDNQAVSLKMNPVNEYLGPHFEKALQPLVDADLLRVAYGGIETGSHLVQHESVGGVHITGSTFSHDAIVWGTDGQQDQRRADNEPLLKKQYGNLI